VSFFFEGVTILICNRHFRSKESPDWSWNDSGLPESITRALIQAYTLKPPCYQTFMAQLLHVLYHFPRNATTGIGGFKQLLKLFPALEMI